MKGETLYGHVGASFITLPLKAFGLGSTASPGFETSMPISFMQVCLTMRGNMAFLGDESSWAPKNVRTLGTGSC